MILLKYLTKEIFKSQIAILFILLLIFFAQQLVRVIRVSLREWQTEYLDAVHFVPLLEGTRR